ncbi:MAG: ECF-type sigma factor [Thermoanaerobaculia bacterium]|nr:ECF-type sigma factor [Thermoanaerobaculia bacterium]
MTADLDPEEGAESNILPTVGTSDSEAHRLLISKLYDELKSLAHRQLQQNRPGLFDTTELVHETFLKLADHEAPNDRGHFFSLAAKVMRQVLVDLGRRAAAAKRGAGLADLPLEDKVLAESNEPERWLAVDEALGQLREVHPRLVDVVECRFFAGLTEDETALALGVTARTVQRDWHRARLWLRELLALG